MDKILIGGRIGVESASANMIANKFKSGGENVSSNDEKSRHESMKRLRGDSTN